MNAENPSDKPATPNEDQAVPVCISLPRRLLQLGRKRSRERISGCFSRYIQELIRRDALGTA